MREQQPSGISELQHKLGKIDQALGKANRVSSFIGTPGFGRPELDISPSSQLDGNAYLDAAIRVGRVRKALTENAIPKLLRDQAQKQIDLKAQKLEKAKELVQLGYLPDYTLKRSQGILQTQASQPVQQEIDDRQAQQKLDELPLFTIETSSQAHLRYRDKLKKLGFTSAFLIARKAGISLYDRNNHLLAVEALRKAGIPIRPYEWISYTGTHKKHMNSILFTRDEERAREALVKDQKFTDSLTTNAQLVCGQYSGDRLKSSEVLESSEYRSLRGLFEELGIRVGGKDGGYANFLTDDCPVPIFRCGNAHRYFTEHEKVLKTFIEKKARDLGRFHLIR